MSETSDEFGPDQSHDLTMLKQCEEELRCAREAYSNAVPPLRQLVAELEQAVKEASADAAACREALLESRDRLRLAQERQSALILPLQALVEQAVDSLFVNGQGERADRLVLTRDSDPPRDLGGWCKGAIVDRLLAALLPQRATDAPEPRER